MLVSAIRITIGLAWEIIWIAPIGLPFLRPEILICIILYHLHFSVFQIIDMYFTVTMNIFAYTYLLSVFLEVRILVEQIGTLGQLNYKSIMGNFLS